VTRHELKTWPAYFQQVWTGKKTFEIRYDDRGYQRGDHVVLREYDPRWDCTCTKTQHLDLCERYTGREINAEIGFVMASTPALGNRRGFIGNGHVVFSLTHVVTSDLREEPPVAPAQGAPTPLVLAKAVVQR
jgi:hypothetical protein